MKSEEFKKIIKEAVREVFVEEMKEILLEAVKSPKATVGQGGYGTVTESVKPINSKPLDPNAKKAVMANILGDMASLVVSASKGELNINAVVEVAGVCCKSCFGSVLKK